MRLLLLEKIIHSHDLAPSFTTLAPREYIAAMRLIYHHMRIFGHDNLNMRLTESLFFISRSYKFNNTKRVAVGRL